MHSEELGKAKAHIIFITFSFQSGFTAHLTFTQDIITYAQNAPAYYLVSLITYYELHTYKRAYTRTFVTVAHFILLLFSIKNELNREETRV